MTFSLFERGSLYLNLGMEKEGMADFESIGRIWHLPDKLIKVKKKKKKSSEGWM
jgi:hypothetical protein